MKVALAAAVLAVFVGGGARALWQGTPPQNLGMYGFYVDVFTLNGGGGVKCGGSLVGPIAVLTAADCVAGGHPLVARIGRVNPEMRNVTRVVFDPSRTVAVAFLNAPAIRNKPVRLASRRLPMPVPGTDSADLSYLMAGTGATGDVFARDSNELLQAQGVETRCVDARPYVPPLPDAATVLCIVSNGGARLCEGDQGAPLVYNRAGNDDVMFVPSAPILHGVALFHMASSDRCCAPSFFPSVYAAVGRLSPWVRGVMANATARDGGFGGCHADTYDAIMTVFKEDGVGTVGTCPPTWPFYASVLAAACGGGGRRRVPTVAAIRDAWAAWTVCNCPMMSTWYAGSMVRARTDLTPDARMECLYATVYPAMYDLRAENCAAPPTPGVAAATRGGEATRGGAATRGAVANITGLKSLKAYVDTLVLDCV